MAHNELEVAAGAGPLACSSAGLWGHRATSRDCSKKQSCKNLRIGINRPRRKGEDTEELLGRVIRNTSDLQHRVIIIIIIIIIVRARIDGGTSGRGDVDVERTRSRSRFR